MRRAMRVAWALLMLAALLVAGPAAAEQPVPVLTARVMDQAGLLDAGQRQALEDKLAAFERDAGPQIVLLLVASTQPEDIGAYAQRVGETWKIGRRDVGDGLLVVVARDDRKIWIAPAKALEGAVPDLAARQIVRDAISPAFKRGDFAGGLNAGVDQLIGRIRGEQLPAPPAAPAAEDQGFGGLLDGGLETLGIFFFVGVPVVGAVMAGVFGRKLGSLLTGGAAGGVAWFISTSLLIAVGAGLLALLLVGVMGVGSGGRRLGGGGRSGHGPPIIFGGGGGDGGGWGGGGGGGFSSGGGGDFGGGGAGGDW